LAQKYLRCRVTGHNSTSAVILTSGHPRERLGKLPPGVAYMRKPSQPLKVLIAAEQELASWV
jgi:hypothetical protein